MTAGAPRSAMRAFLASEAAGGIVLMLAAAAAMIVANSGLSSVYHLLLDAPIGPAFSAKTGPLTPHLLINDGLMAVFFLLVGLEIKRELVDGRLSRPSERGLPAIAAAAGMAVPALVYLAIAGSTPALARGWAIPAATDIAFAVGVLALLGGRAPTSLKLLLISIAVIDDMGAVAIIALAYASQLDPVALAAGGAVLAGMAAMNRLGVRRLAPYLIGFALLWFALLLSGVHATIAGVLAAFSIPVIRTPGAPDAKDSPLHRLEHVLAGPVAFGIVPLFGFANAGVDLRGLDLGDALAPLPLGVAAGLFLGKQLGVFGAIWVAVRLRLASMPRGATWLQIYGLSLLCGIGFTMSLFIGGLAFADPALVEAAKLGTLAGSLLSALAGYALLRAAPLHPDHAREEAEQGAEISDDGDIAAFGDDAARGASA